MPIIPEGQGREVQVPIAYPNFDGLCTYILSSYIQTRRSNTTHRTFLKNFTEAVNVRQNPKRHYVQLSRQ